MTEAEYLEYEEFLDELFPSEYYDPDDFLDIGGIGVEPK